MTSYRSLFLLAMTGALFGGWLAVSSGFSVEWDLLNYHLYNPHALLHGRNAIDLAAAQQQSYLNPGVHLLYYLGFMHLPLPWLVFLTGLVQGSQLLLLYAIAVQVLPQHARRWPILLAVAALGLAGPVFLAELGTVQGDTLLSLPILAALLLLLRQASSKQFSLRETAFAGLLAGVATALKLSMGLYALALAVALLAVFPRQVLLRQLLAWTFGGLLGILLAGGWWMWQNFSAYGNPLFPWFNHWFGSEWAVPLSFRDDRFLPRSLWEAAIYPFVWLINPERVWEMHFRDLRPVLLYPLLFLLPILNWRNWRTWRPGLLLLYLFLLIAWLCWQSQFSIYRYFAVVEMLAPLALFAALALWQTGRGLAIAGVLLLATQGWVSFQRWTENWNFTPAARTALETLPPGSALVIASREPLAFAALYLDDEIPIWRIRANFSARGPWAAGLYESAVQRIRNHHGPLYLLHTRSDMEEGEPEAELLRDDLAAAGLALRQTWQCQPLFAAQDLQAIQETLVCPLDRLGKTASASQPGN